MGRPKNGNGYNGHYTAAQFIEQIPGSGGIISTIARRVGCAWHTAKKYCTTYPTVAKVYQDECEGVTDLAESTVLKAIKDGDITSAKWYLTMKAKDRGYAQRFEIDGILKNLDLSQLTTEQLKRLAAGEEPFHVLTSPTAGRR